MNNVLLNAMIMLAMHAELLEATEIKRKIIVRQLNGKTIVYDLEEVESTTIRSSKSNGNSNQSVKVEIVVDPSSKKRPQQDNKPGSK